MGQVPEIKHDNDDDGVSRADIFKSS